MSVVELFDGVAKFSAIVFEAVKPTCIVLFAAGSGGNPEKHLPFLTALAERGCTIVAPQLGRPTHPKATEAEVLARAKRLRVSLDHVARPGLPVYAGGHSLGASMVVGLASGEMWISDRTTRVVIERDERIKKLFLFAPPTNFFRGPGALDRLTTPIAMWVGTLDKITPPEEAQFLKNSIEGRVPVELKVLEGVGHFTFMDILPPTITDDYPEREALLKALPDEVYVWLK